MQLNGRTSSPSSGPKSTSGHNSRTDCNEGDNCRVDLASSSTVSREKDTCIASNTLPLCQLKEILEC
ncbi:hypothetical protein FRX31_018049 [Thalictrum thalictroides]|uniref:Uncharacterized protein n=1 Tax=Thalictrum thalictroides TaxID=46969 RepID=A0A7J6W5P6_THATH|nr:hypothetical protein FRX31_018049 [Thalictrum thalictroides]